MALDEDDDRARSIELPARRLQLRPARSVAAAGAGDVIVLDRQGHVLGPRQVAFAQARAWGILGLMVGGVGLFYGGVFSATAGVMAAAGATLLVGIQLRHWPRYRAAVVMAATYRWEEAHAAMLALSKTRLPGYWKKSLHVGLASLDCVLGRPAAALERLDALLPGTRASAGYPRLLRWRAEMLRATALARLGRLLEARQQRDAVASAMLQWETDGRRARAEYLDLVLQTVDLVIAFEADTPDRLPDDETLHAWARAALLRTRFGTLLVYLAWVFHRRGDDDMARHLLAEAPARTPRSSLQAEAPRLHEWAEERRAAWEL